MSSSDSDISSYSDMACDYTATELNDIIIDNWIEPIETLLDSDILLSENAEEWDIDLLAALADLSHISKTDPDTADSAKLRQARDMLNDVCVGRSRLRPVALLPVQIVAPGATTPIVTGCASLFPQSSPLLSPHPEVLTGSLSLQASSREHASTEDHAPTGPCEIHAA
jgi:hypothetical protein